MASSYHCLGGRIGAIVGVGESMFVQSLSAVRQISWHKSVSAARRAVQRPVQDESGQDLIEYALIAGLIGLGTLVGVHGAANTIVNYILTVTTAFSTAV